MTPLVLAAGAGAGIHLLFTALVFRDDRASVPVRDRLAQQRRAAADRADAWLSQAGLGDVRPREFLGAMAVLFVVGVAGGFVAFGGVVVPLVTGAFAATVPPGGYRTRRWRRRERAREAWPRLIEEIRIQTGAVGRSVPQALFHVGQHAPEELRPAFEEARRVWALTTDFERAADVLRARLTDPTADAACEALVLAHAIGGNQLDARLEALAEARRIDVQQRRDARAAQAGVRFARRFVLLVPLGMAAAGMAIGGGRASYASAGGQVAVTIALGLIALCWVWAGRLMRLPDQQRVLTGAARTGPPS